MEWAMPAAELVSSLVSSSLTSPFSTNMAISDTKGQGVESYPYLVKEGQRYINLNPQPATQKGKGLRGSFKLLRQRLQQGKTTIAPQD